MEEGEGGMEEGEGGREGGRKEGGRGREGEGGREREGEGEGVRWRERGRAQGGREREREREGGNPINYNITHNMHVQCRSPYLSSRHNHAVCNLRSQVGSLDDIGFPVRHR